MPEPRMRTYDSFDAWSCAQAPEHAAAIAWLRDLVRRVAPRLEEASKWGNGCWMKGDLPLLFLHAKADHLQFGFFGGARLADPKKLLRGKAKFVRHIRIEGPEDLDEGDLATMIRRAVRAPAYK